jgi:hypothetical protein
MRTLLATIAICGVLTVNVYAAAITVEQVKACEAAYWAKERADKAAAPEGYKPARPKDYRANFIASCLNGKS